MPHEKPEAPRVLSDHIDAILNVFGDGIYISDRQGRTLKINRMYERLTGLKREELLGKRVTDLTSAGVFDTALNPEVVRSGMPRTSVQVVRGGRRVVLNAFPVFDDRGEVVLVVTLVRDVTVMAQLKAQIAEQKNRIETYGRKLQHLFGERLQKTPLVAESPEFLDLLRRVKKIAETDVTVLLLGETGVGKDVLARQIHADSPRNGKPFFKVDCTSIPHNLIESELFGYAPGAFSGASARGKIGFFEMADQGTLMLDEVGEFPPAMQAKLLRVLQDFEIVRVGSTRARRVDVRILAATNRDLEREVERGRFRSDLFYRLQVAVVRIPPLRERKKDILPLAHAFLDHYSNKYHKRAVLSPDTEAIFCRYHWPGNVRELENLLQGLAVTCENPAIGTGDLPDRMRSGPCGAVRAHGLEDIATDGMTLRQIMASVEKRLLLEALQAEGSVAKVARRFHVDRTTIFRKLKKYTDDPSP